MKKNMKNLKIFKNKKIIVTGHTGFKGSWLTLWLLHLGSKIMGISNSENISSSNFKLFNLKEKIIHKKVDLRNSKKIKKLINTFEPDFIFHLAAQAIVKESFKNPKATWETNTIGTINILESLKKMNKSCVAVIITSDKVYRNLEIKRGYRENDLLGGIDPYSASKASADIAIKSYAKSFFKKKKIKIGIARAGNVIGGGDWSSGRLIPDCIKSWSKNKKVIIRNPYSTRPWQHVLDVLNGYLTLASNLKKNKLLHGEAFNFGPSGANTNVLKLVKKMRKRWNKVDFKILKNKKILESKLLKLNSMKSKKILKWNCILNLDKSVLLTMEWYIKYFENKKELLRLSLNQIKKFESLKK